MPGKAVYYRFNFRSASSNQRRHQGAGSGSEGQAAHHKNSENRTRHKQPSDPHFPSGRTIPTELLEHICHFVKAHNHLPTLCTLSLVSTSANAIVLPLLLHLCQKRAAVAKRTLADAGQELKSARKDAHKCVGKILVLTSMQAKHSSRWKEIEVLERELTELENKVMKAENKYWRAEKSCIILSWAIRVYERQLRELSNLRRMHFEDRYGRYS